MRSTWMEYGICPQSVDDFRGFDQEDKEKGIVNSLTYIAGTVTVLVLGFSMKKHK